MSDGLRSEYGPTELMSRIAIKVSFITALLFLLFGSSIASDDRLHFVLRAVDGSMSLFPTVGPNNLSNHICVLADGRFYISLHRQEIMDGTATLKNFEGRLGVREMKILHQLLDQDAIKNAAHFELENRHSGLKTLSFSRLRLIGVQ